MPIHRTLLLFSLLAASVPAQEPAAAPNLTAPARPKRAPRPGVTTPGVRREMSAITPAAVFDVGSGSPDWQAISGDALWVTNGPRNLVHRLDVKSNRVAADVAVGAKPCSGLAVGFGSLWVPNCGDHTITRLNLKTNQIEATVPAGPSESEGGIAVSDDAVWLVTDKSGKLSRIDPATNQVATQIDIPPDSAAVQYGEGAVWVTTPAKNLLTRVDAKTNQVTASIPVGPQPRFLTYGAGSLWTLNQGDGTISRIDARTAKLTATVPVGVPGTGGEIAFGNGRVWATVFQIPISEIDPETNQVIRQWFGPGGDSIRFAHGSLWLSNLREHTIWRINPSSLQ